MKLIPVTLQLDEHDYKKLQEYFEDFDDPDISIEVAIRSYISDLSKAMPVALKPNYDVKNYFRRMETWLKHPDSITNYGMYSKLMGNPYHFWIWMQLPFWSDTKQDACFVDNNLYQRTG